MDWNLVVKLGLYNMHGVLVHDGYASPGEFTPRLVFIMKTMARRKFSKPLKEILVPIDTNFVLPGKSVFGEELSVDGVTNCVMSIFGVQIKSAPAGVKRAYLKNGGKFPPGDYDLAIGLTEGKQVVLGSF